MKNGFQNANKRSMTVEGLPGQSDEAIDRLAEIQSLGPVSAHKNMGNIPWPGQIE